MYHVGDYKAAISVYIKGMKLFFIIILQNNSLVKLKIIKTVNARLGCNAECLTRTEIQFSNLIDKSITLTKIFG